MREKVGKSRFTVFFQWFVAPEGRKVGSLKRRVRSQLARVEMKIARRCGAKHISKSPSQNMQNTPLSDHFWKLQCRKSARRCGVKHISKSKCTKTLGIRTTFGSWDVEKVHALVARSTFRSQNGKNTRGSDHFWRFGCRFTSFRFTTLQYITLHYTPQHYNYNCTPLHSITLHYIKLRSSTIYTTLHYTTLHYLPLHFTTLHYTTLHYITPTTTTTLHSTTLNYTTLHSTTLDYITLNDTAPQTDRSIDRQTDR